jgi:hypothetical protein
MVKQLSIFSSNTSEMFRSIATKSKNSGVRLLIAEKANAESILFVRIIFALSRII